MFRFLENPRIRVSTFVDVSFHSSVVGCMLTRHLDDLYTRFVGYVTRISTLVVGRNLVSIDSLVGNIRIVP